MKRTFIVLLLLLTGCSFWMNSKIDGSSTRKYKKSLKSIKAKLSPEQNQKLDAALEILMLPDSSDNSGPMEALTQIRNAGTIDASFLALVNGKTPNQIIAMAMNKTRDKQKKRLGAIEVELAELNRKRACSEQSKGVLAGIVVQESRFYWVTGHSMPEPMVDLRVTNNSGVSLSRIVFHGTLSSPGRSTPLIDEDFSCILSRDLSTGETRAVTVGPGVFSDWAIEQARGQQEAVFTVTVENAKEVSGKDVRIAFDGRDIERMRDLKEMRSEIKRLLRVY